MPEATDGGAPGRLSDETIITPHREVALQNGKRVVVAPWGMTQGRLITQRLEKIQPRLVELSQAKGGVTPHSLLDSAWDDVVDIVALTVGLERSEMERPVTQGGWSFEDLLAVTDAVLDVCLVRSDGRGVLPLLSSLVARMIELDERSSAIQPAARQSGNSGKAGSSRAGSRGGSGSRRR